jgi:hypothetical protein
MLQELGFVKRIVEAVFTVKSSSQEMEVNAFFAT